MAILDVSPVVLGEQDRHVTTFWSHLVERDITSPFFSLLLKLGVT